MKRRSTVFSPGEVKERLEPLFSEKTLRLVLLFGSTASGRRHRHSDIDLGFLLDGPVDLVSLTNNVIRLLGTDSVDVVDLRRASPLLKFSAVRGCMVLFARSPEVFPEFASLAFRMYADTKKLREQRERSIRLFLAGRGLR